MKHMKFYNIKQLSHKTHKFILVCKVKDSKAVGRPENPGEMGE